MTFMWALNWKGDPDNFWRIRRTRRDAHNFLVECDSDGQTLSNSRRNILRRYRRKGLRVVKVRIIEA